jgi:hypothetical protein
MLSPDAQPWNVPFVARSADKMRVLKPAQIVKFIIRILPPYTTRRGAKNAAEDKH